MAANNKLLGKFVSATKQFPRNLSHHPWNLLPTPQIAYDDALYSHSFRKGTMPTTVRLYPPILKAVEMFRGNNPFANLADAPDFMMVSKLSYWTDANGQKVKGKEYFLELLWKDGTGTVMHKKGNAIRISDMESDGTNNPIGEFKTLDEYRMAGIYLLCLPEILEADRAASGKLALRMDDLTSCMPEFGSWQSYADISDMAKESAYFMDAIFCYGNDLAKWEFADAGNPTATVAEQVKPDLTQSAGIIKGAVVCCSNPNVAFRYASSNGSTDGGPAKLLTIGEARAQYSAFSSHRQWSAGETMMIPYFSEDTPVMPETLFIANRIFGTRDAVNPVCNVMWRGVTGFGKSTGVRQLACILHMPLLIMTSHPGMDISELKSTFVPASEDDGLEADVSSIVMPQSEKLSPEMEKAVQHVSQMDSGDRAAFLAGTNFYMDAMMDTEGAAISLLGSTADMTMEELCKLYTDVVCYFREKPLRMKIADLETGGTEKTVKKDNQPAFKHVMSNYIKALINGYMVEIQEPSRIRDSGVLVGINEYDRAGAVIHLMNGGMARRHRDAIVIMTDNVGYNSCRPIDPSVLRRQGLIVDSYELSEQLLKERVRRNTGCTDSKLLNRCYELWMKVKEYCEQNSITEGSVSPVEYERLVQAVMLDGEDSLEENLSCCVISKATSSVEDQRDIRSVLMAV